MKILPFLALAAFAFAAPAIAQDKSNNKSPPNSAATGNATGDGASQYAPGQRFQDKDDPNSPGASEYAPGQLRKNKDNPKEPGASEYAPGQRAK